MKIATSDLFSPIKFRILQQNRKLHIDSLFSRRRLSLENLMEESEFMDSEKTGFEKGGKVKTNVIVSQKL